MVQCWVPECNHRSDHHSCSFFCFPMSPKRRKLWKDVIRRDDASPCKTFRVCACHFANGLKVGAPSRFAWNLGKRMKFKSPEKRRSQSSAGALARKHLVFEEEVSPPNDAVENPPCNANQPELTSVNSQPDDSGPASEVRLVPDISPQDMVNIRAELETLKRQFAVTEAENLHLKEEVERTATICRNSASESSRLEMKLESVTISHMKEKVHLQNELENLKKNERMSFEKVAVKNSKLVQHYTGLPSKEAFYELLKLFDDFEVKYHKVWKGTKLSKKDQLFLTLLKLRRGLTNLDLSFRFNISVHTVSNIFMSWSMALHYVIFTNMLTTIPSREKCQKNMPECFNDYPNTRMILDCTEITSASPTLFSKQCKMFSNYKRRITSKVLVAAAPNGSVIYVSKLYAGSTSDRQIVIDSGILKHCVPSDSIMADKGFLIGDILPDGVTLNIPPFLDTPQFTADQVVATTKIARARIHIERVINRIKQFQILQYIPQFLGQYAAEIVQVCAALTNFQKCVIKEDDSVCSDDSDVSDD